MSKPLSSYPENQKQAVIDRRIKSATLGLGYWSAVKAAQRGDVTDAAYKTAAQWASKR